jgi:hypothetical protein
MNITLALAMYCGILHKANMGYSYFIELSREDEFRHIRDPVISVFQQSV